MAKTVKLGLRRREARGGGAFGKFLTARYILDKITVKYFGMVQNIFPFSNFVPALSYMLVELYYMDFLVVVRVN